MFSLTYAVMKPMLLKEQPHAKIYLSAGVKQQKHKVP